MKENKINWNIPNYVNIPEEHFENIKEICTDYELVGIVSYKEEIILPDETVNGYFHKYRTGFHEFSKAKGE